jgi:hypothetical protein
METGDGGAGGGGEQALWQGGAVVDRFEARKWSGGGAPELSTAVLAVDLEMTAEARIGGRGGRRLGRGAARRCIGARGRVGWGFGAALQFHNGGTVAQWGGGGRRKGPSRGRAPFIEGRGGGRRAARR